MKSTLKLALLASVLMATPVLAANMDNTTTTTTVNGHQVAVDENGNPVKVHHHKHWHHHDADSNYINHDANPNPNVNGANTMHHGYRDADGNWHDANGNVYAHNANGQYVNGQYVARKPGYSWDRNMGNTDSVWMGEHFTTTGMAIGDDDDMNNRGAHDFVLGRGTEQDFREGTGHVVKF